ncbi:MAG: addiction module protein [Isosphaeraceae bacterium]
MAGVTNEDIAEDASIHPRADATSLEHAGTDVGISISRDATRARIWSPRLANPNHAAYFAKEVKPDDLAASPDDIPVHDWQKEELARRKANLLNNPGSGLTWEEVQRKVRNGRCC